MAKKNKRIYLSIENNKTFEDCYDIIQKAIERKRNSWTLTSINWMDFDDVKSIILIHIHKKWHLYDQNKKLLPWLSSVISHQMTNLIRNVFSNYSRPCLKCAAYNGDENCKIYDKCTNVCPLLAYWEKSKKFCYDIKLPLSSEHHQNEVSELPHSNFDLESTAENLHVKMKTLLNQNEWKIYKFLFIDGLSEEETAEKLGYKVSYRYNQNTQAKMIQIIRKKIIDKVKKVLKSDEIDIVES